MEPPRGLENAGSVAEYAFELHQHRVARGLRARFHGAHGRCRVAELMAELFLCPPFLARVHEWVLDPLMCSGRIPNGFGCAGLPLSRPARRYACWGVVRCGWAGSLTLSCTWCGLGGPMPHTISPVVWGRCRPTPDRVSEGASPDGDTGGIVTGHLASGRGQRFLPVLPAPHRGVGRIDRDDDQALFGGHRYQPGLEFPGGDAGDQLPEPFAAAVLLPGLLRAEVEVLDTDRRHTALFGPVQEAGQGVADLCVTVSGGAGEVVGEAVWFADRVAVRIEAVGGEVVGVGVDTDHTPGPGGLPRDGPHEGRCQYAVRYQRPRTVSRWIR